MNDRRGDNSLQDQIADVIKGLEALEENLRALDEELSTHANQRLQYQLLGTICTSLDQLEEMGAASLFWGEDLAGYAPDKQLARVREAVAEFEEKIGAIDRRREQVQGEIEREEVALQLLNEELAEEEREAERKAQEFAIEREGVELPYRSYLMPWSKDAEDQKRHRKIMLAALAFAFILTGVVELMKKPPEKKKVVVLDKKIAALVVKKKAPPKPPPKPQEAQQQPSNVTPQNATTAQTAQAHAAVQNKGLLAEQGGFSSMLGGDDSKLGSDAKVSNRGAVASGNGMPRRNVIGSMAAGGSGGINTSGIRHQGVGGGGGGSITGHGVAIARVHSTTAAGVAKDARLHGRSGAARSDEEIQIVFDRYKGRLYRMYQRQLRQNPTLHGKMTVRITIQPNGSVSSCVVLSSDLGSPKLVNEIVARIRSFNFGAKKGIPAVTIKYGPIDFLPPS